MLQPGLIELAGRLADAAGAAVRSHFRTPIAVEFKSDLSPVTIADRQAEDVMRELLAREVPDHGIFGEERGAENLDSEFVWVLDPIDGTKQFLCGQPTFGTLVALLHRGRPVLGVLDQPILGERWCGVKDKRTQMNGSETSTRSCAHLEDAVSFTPSQNMEEHGAAGVLAEIRQRVRFNRTGLECYAFGLLALGCVDVIVDSWMEPYDFCALVPIVEGAGGVMTDWSGNPLGLESHRAVAAGDARVHEEMLKLLNNRGGVGERDDRHF